MKAIDKLVRAIREVGNPSVMGLDMRLSYLPEGHERAHASPAEAVLRFNESLIDACAGVLPAVKLQAACYEVLGTEGIECMRDTARYAHDHGYEVIIDAKRGDIGSTAEAYAAAYLLQDSPFRCDFLTVNPYLGIDGVKPFIDACKTSGGGIFVLVKTSNPSSGDLQDLKVDGDRKLYEVVGAHVAKWGEDVIGEEGWSSVCAVVGATYPQQGSELRRMMPHTFFLVPGYGAQGATAADVRGCFDDAGEGAIVNSSRGIMLAYRKEGTSDFASAARREAVRMRDELRAVLKR